MLSRITLFTFDALKTIFKLKHLSQSALENVILVNVHKVRAMFVSFVFMVLYPLSMCAVLLCRFASYYSSFLLFSNKPSITLSHSPLPSCTVVPFLLSNTLKS